MWLQSFVYLLIAVTQGFTKDVGFRKFHNVPRQNKILFEDKILKEFPSTNVLISTEDLGILDDVTTIKDKNLIILRDLKLDNEPDLQIVSLNSSLEYLSTKIEIKAGKDVVFIGKIYVNDDQEPIGDVSYTLKNLIGSGIVGLAAGKNDAFTSTNYLMEYDEDETVLNCTYWNNKNARQYEIDASYLPAKQLNSGIRRVINEILKKRLDASFAGIQLSRIFAFKRSNLASIKKRANTFYNGLVDSILEELNYRIIAKNTSRIPLDELIIPFTYKLVGLSVSGRVVAWEGWFENLATFVRRGQISVSFDNHNIILFGMLGLKSLKLGYDVCAIQVAGVGPYAKISGTVGSNAAQMSLLVNFNRRSISLGHFEVTNVENIAVRVDGLGPFNWLASKIASRVVDIVKKDVVSVIEPKVEEELGLVLNHIDAAKTIDHYLINMSKKRNSP